jgi:hypothetical protein
MHFRSQIQSSLSIAMVHFPGKSQLSDPIPD